MNGDRAAHPHSYHQGPTKVTEHGLTKREYMAAVTLSGLLANANIDSALATNPDLHRKAPEVYAELAVRHADALLARLARNDGTVARHQDE